ncbi:unnamed protein product [Sphagnum balticum]
MDVVIEGKITPDQDIADVIQTVIDLKNMPNLVLRVTDEDSDLQGRVAFREGGYILGARVNHTNECGYDAIRLLLSIKSGNYAILDPGRTPNSDTNQTLWISADKVLNLLPALPESPETLLGIDPASRAEQAFAHPSATLINLPSAGAPSKKPNDTIHSGHDVSSTSGDIPVAAVTGKATQTNENSHVATKSKARTYVRSKLYSIELIGIAILALILGTIVLRYGDVISQFFRESLHF